MITDSLKKKDISKKLSLKTGFSINLSKKLTNELIQIINSNIKLNHLVLKNLGTFKLLTKKERMGRNPKTKQKFLICARKSISFIPSKNLIKKINKIV